MRIFYRRPLSLILCIMLGGFLLFGVWATELADAIAVIPLIMLALTFIKARFIKEHRALIRVALVALSVSLLLSHCYFNLWFKAYERFEGDKVVMTGTIYDVTDFGYYSKVSFKSHSVNGEPFSTYNVLFYLDADEVTDFIAENAVISLSGKLTGFESDEVGFNAESYYLSRGFSAKVTEIEDINFIETAKPSLLAEISNFRTMMTNRIISQTDEESGGLMAALLLGDREHLSPQINLDFRRIGISHILALSGSHLSILAIGLSKLLGLFGVGKKPRFAFTILFTCAYVTLTGFSVSVLRAGLMLVVSYSLFLFAKTHDSLTSLFISVTLICLFEPHAILDISLWLSALATLGIVVLGDVPREHKKAPRLSNKLLHGIKSSFDVSLFAMSATFLITLLSFDTVSLLAPISTFIFAPIIELFLYAGIVLLALGDFLAIGRAVRFLGSFIARLAARLSDLDGVCISSNLLLLKIMIIAFTLCFFIFLLIEVRKKRRGIRIVSCLMCTILIAGTAIGIAADRKRSMIYESGDDSESLLLRDQGEATLIAEAAPSTRSAYADIATVYAQNATELDRYIINEYSLSLPSALKALLSNILIDEICLPKPKNDYEERLLEGAREIATKFRTQLRVYSEKSKIETGMFTFSQYYHGEYKSSGVKSCFTIEYGNETLTYVSSGFLSGDTKNVALEIMNRSSIMILGRHGTRYYNYKYTYVLPKAKVLILSSKNVYVSPYTLEQYAAAEVYTSPRTVKLIH